MVSLSLSSSIMNLIDSLVWLLKFRFCNHNFIGQKVFEWDQTLDEVNMYIALPPNVPTKQFYSKIQSKHVEVGIKGNPPYLSVSMSLILLPSFDLTLFFFEGNVCLIVADVILLKSNFAGFFLAWFAASCEDRLLFLDVGYVFVLCIFSLEALNWCFDFEVLSNEVYDDYWELVQLWCDKEVLMWLGIQQIISVGNSSNWLSSI